MIAIPWYFSNELGRPGQFGFVYGTITFATLFWGLYAGILIDRYNRQKVYLGTSLSGLVLLALCALQGYYQGSVGLPVLVLGLGATFFIFNIHYPNLYAFLQEIVEPEYYSRITSYIEIQGQSTNALAGAVAALLLTGTAEGTANIFGMIMAVPFRIEPWSMTEVFVLNSVAYALSFIVILLLRYQPILQRQKAVGSIIQRLRDGITYLRSEPLIFIFGTASYAIFVVMLTSTYFLFPVYINNHLQQSADVYGSYEMYVALGSVMAGVGIWRIFGTHRIVKGVVIMTFVTAGVFFWCVFNTWLLIFYLLALLFGFCNAGTRVMRMTYLFHYVPNRVIGRVNSVFQVLNVLFRIIFIYLFALPFFNTGNQIIYAYLICGLFLTGAGFVLVYYYRSLEIQN
jgi:MFS family permease